MLYTLGMNRDDYTEANRAMWNKTAEVHASIKLTGLLSAVQKPDYSTLDGLEQRIFEQLGVAGKAVAQLSCNNGRELLSLAKRGAARCVGFDISDAFIEQGRLLAQTGGLAAEFVRVSVYDIPHAFDKSFDIIYVTIGALGWLPDLQAYFETVARLLKPGGSLFLYEMHPVLDMFDAATGLEVKHSYFRSEPYKEDAGPDYYDPSQTVEGTSYWFHHTLSDVIGGCLANDLTIKHFEEHPYDLSNVYAAFQDFEKKPPLSYSLVARKG